MHTPSEQLVKHWQGGMPDKANAWSPGQMLRVKAYLAFDRDTSGTHWINRSDLWDVFRYLRHASLPY